VPYDQIVEGFRCGPGNRTQQKRVVWPKVLALDRKCQGGVTLVHDRSNIELPDLVSNWIAIGTGVRALEAKNPQLCENLHLEGEVGIGADKLLQVPGS